MACMTRSTTLAARAPARVASGSMRRAVVAGAVRGEDAGLARRDVLLAGLSAAALILASGGPAQARDYKAALAAKEARKAKLRENAGAIKKTGEDKQAFKDAEYAVSEEARTPNVHSRQNEGARSQENV